MSMNGSNPYGARFSHFEYEQQRERHAEEQRARNHQRAQARTVAALRAYTVEIPHGAGSFSVDVEAASDQAARSFAYRLYAQMPLAERDAIAAIGPAGSVKARLIGTKERAFGLGIDLEAQRLVRAATATATATVESARSIGLTFSSEARVPRQYGIEILSHKPGAADLSRLTSGAPLLFNHNMDDVIGVVEAANIGADKRGHATVRFARTTRGDEVLGMVQDRILRNVSFLYSIDDIDDSRAGEFLITKWQPLELSIVTVPADASVGVGRTA